MPRVKRAVHSKKKRKAVLKAAKGYRGGHRRLLRSAKEAVARALQYAYRDRRAKKREFRALWITRVNAAAREQGLSYSQLIFGLKKAGVETIVFDEVEAAKFDAASGAVVERWIAEMNGKGVDGAALVEKARAAIAAAQ